MNNKKQIDTLNELLKGEHMAINIYGRTKSIQGDTQVSQMLDKFQEDHKRHAQQLSERIDELGGEPGGGTGLPGVMADVSAMINSLRGPQHLLEQLYDGEDKGVHAYEDRIDELDSKSQDIVRSIMKEDHEHLKFFEARMEKEKSERDNS